MRTRSEVRLEGREAPRAATTSESDQLGGATVLGLFLCLCLIWGFTYVAVKIGLRYSQPLTFTAMRALVGGLGLVAYALVTTRRFPVDIGIHRSAMVLGLTNVVLFWGLMHLGLGLISAGESSILTYTQPLLVALLAWAWLGEKLSKRMAIGLLLGFAGVIVVAADRIYAVASPTWSGYAFTLGGAIAWAIGTVYFRSRQARLDILWVTTLQALYGTVPLALLAVLMEPLSITLSFDLVWTVAFTGLGSSALAYLIWFNLLRHRAAAEVGSYIFLVPFFAVLFGALALGERLGLTTMLGAGLILIGVYLVNRRTRSYGKKQ